ncbi:MAG: VCBS repeat-containing protein [Deltaproteobacteria bacterium]|nr:VCBS repeat-containing protein [Deltaproteobacteria bacterium]
MRRSVSGGLAALTVLGASMVACTDTPAGMPRPAESTARALRQPLVACTPASARAALPTPIPGTLLATGDVDGDGIGDLVLQSADELVVVRGAADRSFAARRVLYRGAVHRAAAVVDLDGDHRAEIVAATETSLHVFANLGDGTFAENPSELETTGPVEDIAQGDIDGDGRPDIVTANASCAAISIFRARCDGSLAPREDLFPSHSASRVKLADMNGDGRLDLVVAFPGLFAVLPGNGAGVFQRITVPRISRTSDLDVADFDGDGALDVAFRDAGMLSLHLNDGSGNFGFATRVPDADVSLAFTAMDIDGDGRAELLGVRAPETSPGHWPVRAISSVAPLSLLSFRDGALDRRPAGAIVTRDLVGQARIADLDGDGHLDAAITTSQGVVSAFGREGGPRSEIVDRIPDVSASGYQAADLDGDGTIDAVWTTFERDADLVAVALRKPDGELAPPTLWPTEAGIAREVRLADMDWDGLLDLVVLGAGELGPGELPGYIHGRLQVRRNLGGGSFGPPRSIGDFADVATMQVGDLDGDGYPDVIVGREAFLNDAMGGLVPAGAFPKADAGPNREAAEVLTSSSWPISPWGAVNVTSRGVTKLAVAKKDDAFVVAPIVERCRRVVAAPVPRGEPSACRGGEATGAPPRAQVWCPRPSYSDSVSTGSVDWNGFRNRRDAGADAAGGADASSGDPTDAQREEPPAEEAEPTGEERAPGPSAPLRKKVVIPGCAFALRSAPPGSAAIATIAGVVAALVRRRTRRV